MSAEPDLRGYRISSWLFVRLLGLVYLCAFASFLSQAQGLVGPNGILPLAPYLHTVAAQVPDSRFWALPTLSWLDPAHPPLLILGILGMLASLSLLLGLAPLPSLALLWLLYLSLVSDGQEFMGFQWDNLLLECGLCALLLAPTGLLHPFAGSRPAPRAARWLLYWLLFRLILGSGVVKLSSGDPHWRDLSALEYHFWTQPLPLWTSWYVRLLPDWFQTCACAVLFAVELGAPLLIPFAPTRKAAFAAIAGLMALIALTGNYCFFNLLTLVLCLPLVEDTAWPAWLKTRLQEAPARIGPRGAGRLGGPARSCGAALIAALSLPPFLAQLGVQPAWPAWIVRAEEGLAPLRSINNYGLFAVMTTSRHEIILQGSDNGVDWKDYELPYKPGDPRRRPGLAAPFQPRLDWQLWFAALGERQDNPWFSGLCLRLLQGSPEVLGLFSSNPFPGRAPRYLRARLYEYRFSAPAEKRAAGAWWSRTLIGDYFPTVQLSQKAP